ncbi:MAG: hypothetical protein ACXWMG_01025 [Candidatus Limnocylindria bacterium]
MKDPGLPASPLEAPGAWPSAWLEPPPGDGATTPYPLVNFDPIDLELLSADPFGSMHAA